MLTDGVGAEGGDARDARDARDAALVTALAQGTLTVRVAGEQTQRWEATGRFFEGGSARPPGP